MRSITFCACLLLLVSTAHAQSPEHAPAKLKIAYASFAASELLDSASTHLALKRGAREANGNIAGCVSSLACSLSLKSAISIGAILAVHKGVEPQNRKAAFWLMLSLAAAQGAIDVHNFSVARNQR